MLREFCTFLAFRALSFGQCVGQGVTQSKTYNASPVGHALALFLSLGPFTKSYGPVMGVSDGKSTLERTNGGAV